MGIHELRDENGNVIHACATASFPLPKDHWIYGESAEPVPFSGFDNLEELRVKVRDAMRYTIQVCTRHGKDEDIDPDAVCQTMERSLFGSVRRPEPVSEKDPNATMRDLLNRLVQFDWCIGYELTADQCEDLDEIRTLAAELMDPRLGGN